MPTHQDQEIKLHALDYWQVIRNRYGVILLAFFLVFMTATVITYMMPKEYLGRVEFQIRPEGKEIEIDRRSSYNNVPHQTFIQNQFEIIESKENLDKVVKEMDLADKWGYPTNLDAYNRLLKKLRTQDVRASTMFEIEVFDPDPKLAADLANKIADSYKERRAELEKTRALKALEHLELQAKREEKIVEEARREMFDLAKEHTIIERNNPWGSSPGELNDTSSPMVERSKIDLYEAKREIEQLRTQIETLVDLDGDHLIKAAVLLGLESPTLAIRYPEYLNAKLDERSLRDDGLGRLHPKVLAMQGRIDGLLEILEVEVDITKRALATRMKMAEDLLAVAERTKDATEDEALQDKEAAVSYVMARDRFELHKNLLAELNEEIAIKIVDGEMYDDPIQVHERAEVSNTPAKPNVNLQLAIGAGIGLVFGVGLAFFLEYLDTSVKSLEDVERYLKIPVLAVVPKDVGILHRQNGASPDAEAYRILRTNIEFNRKSADANAITLVSGGAGEGKSTTLVNLAYICAQGGYNTLMIDGDLRRPKLHTFFDINNSVGLTNYLTTDLALEDVILQTPVDNLFFMPSGILPADAAGILNSRRMSELITDVKSRFDLVLIDSPPILGVSDASVLASEVDLTMVVIQHRKLPRNMLIRVKEAVENVGGNLLGVVLNNVDVRSDSQYQYYTSYYTYYAPSEHRAPVTPRENPLQSKPPKQIEVTADADDY